MITIQNCLNLKQRLRKNGKIKRWVFSAQSAFQRRWINKVIYRRLVGCSKVNGQILIRLVRGWRNAEVVEIAGSQLVEPLANVLGELLDTCDSPLYLAGRKIVQSDRLLDIVKICVTERRTLTWPLQVVTAYLSDPLDGNFNSLMNEEILIDLKAFRKDPAFHFLTPGSRVQLLETEHYRRLCQMGLDGKRIKMDMNRLQDSSRVDARIPDGLTWSMDIIHHLFVKQIEYLSPAGKSVNIVEIGGGVRRPCATDL